jgi:S-methylmethionine-dependent homocysteine/selenocysteine methylase
VSNESVEIAQYRSALPQLSGDLFLTDGGIETTLIFQEGFVLPHFAAFSLLRTLEGIRTLDKYFRTYAEIAKQFHTGLILESPTWRASAEWGTRLGYDDVALTEANFQAINLLERVRQRYETDQTPIVISGCIGPRGDGYVPDRAMTVSEAEQYHSAQVETFARSAADMVCGITMNYVEEAIGIAQAAREFDMPVAIAFTVETDGALPTGQTLASAIEQVDEVTGSYPVYYMINCAHPTHFEHVLTEGSPWVYRIHGLRANASRMSHAELNDAPELDSGNPAEFGLEYAMLKKRLQQINVMGGCCGTDHRHIQHIASACMPFFRDVA